MGLKPAEEMRRESANYIGARSFRAAIKPEIKLQPTVDVRTMDAFANGMRSY
ncbi:oxidoreductase, partial [Escherichia coli]|nr:oxidoreductase [Escherichia coli]